MVCDRCIKVVREELEKLKLDVRSVKLGEAEIAPGKQEPDLKKIRNVLQINGFDLLDHKHTQIVEKIKNVIVTLVHHNHAEKELTLKTSDYLEKEVGLDYHYLSTLFSSIENITIEKYMILQKIERVKELLKYNELTLSEIAYRMGYSSVAHLSSQFKKGTGLSASEYKKLKDQQRISIDKI
jgi:YesN/AraC family two-component response regulator